MIERIWLGAEAEGFEKGRETAFVEAETLGWIDIDTIRTNVSAGRLYFGANERDVKSVPNGFFAELGGDYQICVETTQRNLAFILSKVPYNALIILRNTLDISDKDLLKIRYKFRTPTGLVVFRDGEYTELHSLDEDGLYAEDILIYKA